MEKIKHLFPYEWNLKDGYPAKGIPYHGSKVFSCFACGGGSTMGYKLAGYDVIGCNEIDPKMMEVYKINHNPKYSFLEPIQTFKNRQSFPDELYNLDILDGSPPCSSFSMAGNREKDWGKKKKFREGQKEQVLDTLFFDFIELAGKLKPKIVIAENVKGLLLGSAKSYVERILFDLEREGYYSKFFLLKSSVMGVPQKRERVFFIALRKDIAEKHLKFEYNFFNQFPVLDLYFNEIEIPYKEIEQNYDGEKGKHIPPKTFYYWEKIEPGQSCSLVHEKGHFFQELKLHPNKVLPTLRAGSNSYYHYKIPRRLLDKEIQLAGSFPLDFNFLKNPVIYVVGMSVPPVMTAQIAHRIYNQWLSKIN